MGASQLLYWFLMGVVLGVAGASFFVWGGALWALMSLAVAVSVVWRRNGRVFLVASFLLGAAVGWWRMDGVQGAWHMAAEHFVSTEISAEVVAVGDSQAYGWMRSVPARFVVCEADSCPRGDTLLVFPAAEQVWYGDRIRVSCQLELPENFDPRFDYRMFLAKEGVGTVCRTDRIEHAGRLDGILARVASVRRVLEQSLARVVPEPESGLLQGLLFGGSGRLSKDMQDRFAQTGLTHIVAVSGQNVMLVAEGVLLSLIALGLWRKQAFWWALLGIWIFVVGTGAEASAVRAGIMGTLGFVALNSGRLSNGWRLVVFAAAGMLLYNPLLFRYDIGFQLSFLATLTLLAVFRSDRALIHGGAFGAVREIMVATLAIEFVTAPILLYDFGFVSVVAVAANILALPFVPLAMGCGFAAAVFGWVLPLFAGLLGWLAYLSGAWIIGVVRILSDIPFSVVRWELSSGMVLVWYTLVGVVWVWMSRRKMQSEEKHDTE